MTRFFFKKHRTSLIAALIFVILWVILVILNNVDAKKTVYEGTYTGQYVSDSNVLCTRTVTITKEDGKYMLSMIEGKSNPRIDYYSYDEYPPTEIKFSEADSGQAYFTSRINEVVTSMYVYYMGNQLLTTYDELYYDNSQVILTRNESITPYGLYIPIALVIILLIITGGVLAVSVIRYKKLVLAGILLAVQLVGAVYINFSVYKLPYEGGYTLECYNPLDSVVSDIPTQFNIYIYKKNDGTNIIAVNVIKDQVANALLSSQHDALDVYIGTFSYKVAKGEKEQEITGGNLSNLWETATGQNAKSFVLHYTRSGAYITVTTSDGEKDATNYSLSRMDTPFLYPILPELFCIMPLFYMIICIVLIKKKGNEIKAADPMEKVYGRYVIRDILYIKDDYQYMHDYLVSNMSGTEVKILQEGFAFGTDIINNPVYRRTADNSVYPDKIHNKKSTIYEIDQSQYIISALKNNFGIGIITGNELTYMYRLEVADHEE